MMIFQTLMFFQLFGFLIISGKKLDFGTIVKFNSAIATSTSVSYGKIGFEIHDRTTTQGANNSRRTITNKNACDFSAVIIENATHFTCLPQKPVFQSYFRKLTKKLQFGSNLNTTCSYIFNQSELIGGVSFLKNGSCSENNVTLGHGRSNCNIYGTPTDHCFKTLSTEIKIMAELNCRIDGPQVFKYPKTVKEWYSRGGFISKFVREYEHCENSRFKKQPSKWLYPGIFAIVFFVILAFGGIIVKFLPAGARKCGM